MIAIIISDIIENIGGVKMAYTKASQKAVDKYISKNYEQFSIRFKKGQRDKYKEYAESQGKSLNALIIELLENEMKQEH